MNPEIALIGLLSLTVLVFFAMAKNKTPQAGPGADGGAADRDPARGSYFSLGEDHTYTLADHQYTILSKDSVVNLPDERLPFDALEGWGAAAGLPGSADGGGLEVGADVLADREPGVAAVGEGDRPARPVEAEVEHEPRPSGVRDRQHGDRDAGGLPMISEIVRSKANIDNGAPDAVRRHVARRIPAGVRGPLSGADSPDPQRGPGGDAGLYRIPAGVAREFIHLWNIGREQLVIFVATIIGVLATDLLVGIAIGIATKFVIHMMNGVSPWDLFKTYLEVQEEPDGTCLVTARESAVFSNWIPFKRQLEQIGLVQRNNIVLDLSNTKLVDTTFIEKLHGLQSDFTAEGLSLKITGLDSHRSNTGHALCDAASGSDSAAADHGDGGHGAGGGRWSSCSSREGDGLHGDSVSWGGEVRAERGSSGGAADPV